jgi:hypothetical protein
MHSSHTNHETAYSGDPNSPTSPVSATWLQNRPQDPPPVPDPCPRASAGKTPTVGQRTELARYTVAEGERIIYGQRIEGSCGSPTGPPHTAGGAYLIERDLESKAELDALVADYLLCRVRHRRYYADPLNMPTGM